MLGSAPTAFGHALCALDLYLGPSREVAIVGDPGDARTRALVDEVVAPASSRTPSSRSRRPATTEAAEAVPLLRDRPQMDGLPTAYVCERFACRLPVTRPKTSQSN